MTENQTEAPEIPKESQVFMVEGELRDAWGRPADADESVNFDESKYMSYTVADLKVELKTREEAGREFDKSQIKTKRDLVAALEADDREQAEEARKAAEEEE